MQDGTSSPLQGANGSIEYPGYQYNHSPYVLDGGEFISDIELKNRKNWSGDDNYVIEPVGWIKIYDCEAHESYLFKKRTSPYIQFPFHPREIKNFTFKRR